ncbi:M16 family metallopeptidase [Anoxybacillus sp. TBDG-1]
MKIKKKLKNGIRVICECQKNVEVVSFGFWFQFGSAYETQINNGISHFLEHIINKQEFEAFIENRGGKVECITSKEYISFNVTVNRKDFLHCLRKVADQIFSPKITNEIIESERAVVIEEIKMYQSDLLENVLDNISRCIFKEQSSLSLPILGSENNILNFDLEQLSDTWYNKILKSPLVVSINGGVDEKQLYEALDYIENIRKENKSYKISNFEYCTSLIVEKSLHDVSILNILSYLETSDIHQYILPEIFTFHLTNSGQNALLIKELRKRGLSYQTFSYYLPYTIAGVLGITALFSSDKLLEVINTIKSTLKSAAQISLKDFERIKNMAVNQSVILYETTFERMKFQAKNSLLSREDVFVDNYLARLSEVGIKDYISFVRDMMNREKGYFLFHNNEILDKNIFV